MNGDADHRDGRPTYLALLDGKAERREGSDDFYRFKADCDDLTDQAHDVLRIVSTVRVGF